MTSYLGEKSILALGENLWIRNLEFDKDKYCVLFENANLIGSDFHCNSSLLVNRCELYTRHMWFVFLLNLSFEQCGYIYQLMMFARDYLEICITMFVTFLLVQFFSRRLRPLRVICSPLNLGRVHTFQLMGLLRFSYLHTNNVNLTKWAFEIKNTSRSNALTSNNCIDLGFVIFCCFKIEHSFACTRNNLAFNYFSF